jgi:predicted transcriptional regulator
MKTATIPSLRVAPELRQAAESVLDEGETLSAFVEQSIRSHIQQRRHQQEFIARGLAARDEARRSGRYYSAKDVCDELDDLIKAKEDALPVTR